MDRHRSSQRRALRGGALSALALALAAPAFAQTIVVTAERRPQSTETLAGNAASIGADELSRIDAQVPAEALNRLPGVAIHRNNGVENLPAIRSPVLIGGQSAGSFLLLEDGVPIRAAGFSNVNSMFETSMDFADRVEVVRGPGSALYGSNAVHGLVNVLTPVRTGGWYAPPFQLARASIEAGSFGRESGTVLFAGGAGGAGPDPGPDTDLCLDHCYRPLEYFVGLHVEHTDGWRDAADLSRQHALLGFNTSLGDWEFDGRVVLQNLNQQSAGFIEGVNAYDNSAFARTNPTPGAHRDQQLIRGRLTLARSFGDWRVSFTPYARSIDSALQLFFLPSRAREQTMQSGYGLQSILYWDPDQDFSLILGADAEHADGALFEFQTRPTQPGGYVQGLHYDYEVAMETLALYAQASWAFAPDWRLVAGLRGERLSYDYDNHAPVGDVGRFRRAADREDEFENVTPKLGLVWNPGEGHTLWLNLARGARAPQITDLYSLQTLQNPGEQREETLDSVELGWRGALGPARLEIAAYHMEKDGAAFRASNGFTITGASSRHEGVEVSGVVPLGESFDLAGWITYARHTYRSDAPADGVVTGNDIDTAPRWIANARARWRPTDALDLELEWAHMGEYFTNAANTRTYPGHDVFTLRGEYELSAALTLYGAIRNLTNTDFADRADFAFGNDRYFPGEDRAYTLGLRLRR